MTTMSAGGGNEVMYMMRLIMSLLKMIVVIVMAVVFAVDVACILCFPIRVWNGTGGERRA